MPDIDCCGTGVEGIGTEESKIAIFEVEGGERGVVAVQVRPFTLDAMTADRLLTFASPALPACSQPATECPAHQPWRAPCHYRCARRSMHQLPLQRCLGRVQQGKTHMCPGKASVPHHRFPGSPCWLHCRFAAKCTKRCSHASQSQG